jgi:hydroxymethylglutaryl-CoA lyase
VCPLPANVILHEVVLRDGIQTETRILSTEEKLNLMERLVESGVRRIEVSSFVNPRLVPQMADAEKLWAEMKRHENVLYSALILGRRSLERAMECAVPHVGIFVSASETHSRKNSNRTVAEAQREALDLIGTAKTAGMEVRAGVMNAFGCAYEGAVPIERVMDLIGDYMTLGPDELCLADTSGMANPRQMKEVLVRVKEVTGGTPISLHLHNTRGLGLANVWEALQQGVCMFDTSLGGLGGCPFIPGARGNIATEDTVHMLHEIGIQTGIDMNRLVETSRNFESMMGREFPATISHLPNIGSCNDQ